MADFLTSLPNDIETNVRNFLAGKARLSTTSRNYLTRFAGSNAWMLGVEELAKIAIRAWSGEWTQERTTAAVESSTWYRTHVERQRQWAGMSAVDQNRAIQEQSVAMAAYWEQVSGIRRQPADFLADARAVASGAMAEAAWRWRQDEAALKIPESPLFRQRRSEEEAERERPVTIENVAGQLEEQARGQFLTAIDRDTATQWATDIVEKVASEQDFIDWIRERAASKFPEYAERIQNGGTPAQLFGDYLQMARDELESAAITFDDTRVMSGIQQSMTLADYQGFLRSDPTWKTTKRAENMSADFATQLLETFGKIVA